MYDDIASNAEEFAKQLERLGQQIEDDIFDKVVRKFIFWMLGRLVQDNPKDTVRSAGSWMAGTEWTDFALPPGDYTGIDLGSRVRSIVNGLSQSEHFVLYNNLDYIIPLENGHSKQAPSGFIAQVLAAAASEVARLAKAAGYEATS